MKEVERVSLGGYAFTLESDAAELAGKYLGELERHYASREGGTEILEGIEERMAELLHERCGKDGVASRAVIEGIIAILGRPEQIEGDSEPEPGMTKDGTAKEKPGTAEEKPKRKLYRDVSDKVVAGVCSGLGIYFGMDKVIFRLAFALLTLATVLVFDMRRGWSGDVELVFPALYLILWICMPPAKTVRQRWEQHGEDGTILGIQQRIPLS